MRTPRLKPKTLSAMKYAQFLFRLFDPKRASDFDRAVEQLRERPGAEAPITKEELLVALRALVARDPRTEEELTLLEAESFILSRRIQNSPVCHDMPHFVWHFLSDPDIRFKDKEYKVTQCHDLIECLAEWDVEHGT